MPTPPKPFKLELEHPKLFKPEIFIFLTIATMSFYHVVKIVILVAESEFIVRFSTGCSHIPTTVFDFRRA